MTDDFDGLIDDDFEEVITEKAKAALAPVTVSIVRMGRTEAKGLVFSLAAEIVDQIKAVRVRVDWNRIKGVYRLRADDQARYQVNTYPRSTRRWVRIPFPADDLYEVEGAHPATYRVNPTDRSILVQVPQAFLQPPAAPSPSLAPDPAPDRLPVPMERDEAPMRHPGAPLDDPLVVRAALGLPATPALTRLGDQRFTPAEAEIVRLLAQRQIVTRQAVMIATADPSEDDDQRDDKVVDVLLVRIRRKLKALGIDVETVRGAGWNVPGAQRARLKAMIQAAAAEESA